MRSSEVSIAVAVTLMFWTTACSGGSSSEGDADAVADTVIDLAADTVTDMVVEVPEDTPEDTMLVDSPEDTATGPDVSLDTTTEWDAASGYFDELGTNNQDITGVERVIFLGDSITASPYLTPPWSDRIRDDLQGVFGASIEIHNYAVGGARTEHVLEDQIPNIDTTSTKKTLVMFTIGGNDALQVIGSDIPTSLAHMETKMVNLRGIMDFMSDPGNFPGGVYVVFSNIYDPTDGEGDFTHCGIGALYEDWPNVDELATTVNEWYLDLAMEFGFDVLNAHALFLGHGWNNNDTASPYYCFACDPECPCDRWLDLTCIHPNADGHEALAGYFLGIATR